MLRCWEGRLPDAMRLGNCEPVPVFKLFVCIVGVNGRPVWNVPMALICHPPAIHCRGRADPLIQCRPWPNGSWYVPLTASLCRTSKVELACCDARSREF